MANWLTARLPWGRARAVEGQYRPGPYMLSGGWLSASAGRYVNWWQSGHNLQPYGTRSAMVEACISSYAQTSAMCAPDHWRSLSNGGRERVTNSALSRVMRRPNDYQSISDFMLNLTRRAYERGEAFALGLRNNRGEIDQLHLMREGKAAIAVDGSVFYSLWGNEVIEARLDVSEGVPARDVLHVRLQTPRHPLRGESPILAAALDLAMQDAVLNQQIAFYINRARPSFILETDQVMTQEQAELLSQRWREKTSGENAGNTPLATHGLKAHLIETNAVDGQLAEMLKLTDEQVALCMRIPLPILGIGQTTYASAELHMQDWIAKGLGFWLNHVEEAFGLLYGLKGVPDEYLEFDTKALLRSAYRERIEALARGVISGIYSPDEARAQEDLPAVPGGVGAEPRVQEQVLPLSFGFGLSAADKYPSKPTATAESSNANEEPATKDGVDRALRELDLAGGSVLPFVTSKGFNSAAARSANARM